MTTPPDDRRADARRPSWFAKRSDAFLHRPWLVAAALALACIALDGGLSWAKWPAPEINDEFSNLLAADTFAAGRLANPTHPQWQHFESFHILQQPSYASKYPPGLGLFLALGEWLTGEPIVGAWILSGVAAVALYWMLLGCTSPKWAALGGVLFLLHPGYQLQWSQTFFGAGLAFAGGALVFGAAVRMTRRARLLDAVAMSAGALALAASRPFEGFVFCLATGAWLVFSWARTGMPPSRQWALRTVLPTAILLGAGVIALAGYNRAVTGDPLTMPYTAYEAHYAVCPMFLGQQPKLDQKFRHETMARFNNGWAMDWFRCQQSPTDLAKTKWRMTRFAALFYFPPLMAAPLLLLKPWRLGRLKGPLMIAAVTLLVSLVSIFNFPNYLAPFAPLLLLAVVWGFRAGQVRARRLGVLPHFALLLVGFQAAIFASAAADQTDAAQTAWHWQRAKIAARLEQMPGQQLVVVRYGDDHNPCHEWVYNRADIDGSKVVWAREMGGAADRELLTYFRDRQAWLLVIHETECDLMPYAEADEPAPPQ